MYDQACFKDESKFFFLIVTDMKIPQVASFAMYREVSSYEHLKNAIQKYDSGIRSFYSTTGQEYVVISKLISERTQKGKKFLIRPVTRVKNME